MDSPEGEGGLPTARKVAPWTTPPVHRPTGAVDSPEGVKGGCPPDNPPAMTTTKDWSREEEPTAPPGRAEARLGPPQGGHPGAREGAPGLLSD